MTPTERRISAIEGEIDRLEYAPWGVDIAARRGEMQAELVALTQPENMRTAA